MKRVWTFSLMIVAAFLLAAPTVFAGHHEKQSCQAKECPQCVKGKCSAKECPQCAKKACPFCGKIGCTSCAKKGDKRGYSHGYGRGYGHHRGDSHGNLFLDYADELKLTDKQVAELNRIRNNKKEKKTKLKKKFRASMAELNRMSHGKDLNKKKLVKLTKKIGALKGKMLKVRILSLYEAKKVLTDDQQKMMNEKFQKYHSGLVGKEDDKVEKTPGKTKK